MLQPIWFHHVPFGHHITSHHITARHITARHITSTSYHITFTRHSHHSATYRIASHHITSHHQKRSPKRLPNAPPKSPTESQNGLPILQNVMARWDAPKWNIPLGTWSELVPNAKVGFGAPKPTIALRKISRLFQSNSGDLRRTCSGRPAGVRRT